MSILNLSVFESYLLAIPAIMIGSILFGAGLVLLLQSDGNDRTDGAEPP
jgi:hypothetical protein